MVQLKKNVQQRRENKILQDKDESIMSADNLNDDRGTVIPTLNVARNLQTNESDSDYAGNPQGPKKH
jgi:hypothetical protein